MKEFLCEICEQKFKNRTTLSRHFKQQHKNSGNSKGYKCNVCTNYFHSQGSKALHIKTAHERKHYNCDSCGKSLSEAGNLKRHQNSS